MTIALGGCLLARATAASDWPAWRYDVRRTAASEVELPAELHLQWKRQLQRPRPSFPSDHRTCVDLSYEPVIAGGRLFVPSMVTNSVSAYELATGDLLWRFFVGGPVRFAPVASSTRRI